MHALSTASPVSSEKPLPEMWVERVFMRLQAQLGAKMADLFAGAQPDQVKAEWADGLAGFHASEIGRGLKACQSRIFAPTLGEFTRLCRPALDPEIAFMEAAAGMLARNDGKQGEWSHPAVYRTACEMAFELRSQSYAQVRKAWSFKLEREFARGWLADVPEPALRIEKQALATRGPNAAEKAAIAALLGRVKVSA